MSLRTTLPRPPTAPPLPSPLRFPVSTAIPLLTRITAFLRLFWATFVLDNPLWWARLQGARNVHADMEDPFYIAGAPDRTVAPGRAVMASLDGLKAAPVPFLLILNISAPDGTPLPNVLVDLWQADWTGGYAAATYALRGTARTDSRGRLEILTVPPGSYGPASHRRAGHFHLRISAPRVGGDKKAEYGMLTTQLYLCPGNEAASMKSDFLNYVRTARTGNCLQAYISPSTSSSNAQFFDLPVLDKEAQAEAAGSIAQWDDVLALSAGELKVGGVAEKHLQLEVEMDGLWSSLSKY